MNTRLNKLNTDEIKIKNRVNHLEQEELRILKKLEQTRVKAERIHEIKVANDQNFLARIHR